MSARTKEEEASFKRIASDVLDGRMPVHEAVERIIDKMGRGGRVLVVDENNLALEAHLVSMNYTVEIVRAGASDDAIKESMRGRVIVTENGQHFNDEADLTKYYYGVVWIPKGDPAKVAQRVKAVLMETNFAAKLQQVVRA